jgi:hypothetical protein
LGGFVIGIKYKINEIYNDKDINEIIIDNLIKMICENNNSMLISKCTYKIPKIGGKNY